MPDESNEMPMTRVLRWAALGALILGAAALYFRHGRDIPPIRPAPEVPADTAGRR